MFVEFATAALVTMLVTLDPPGLAPIFLSLTRGMSAGEQRQVAIRASIIEAGATSDGLITTVLPAASAGATAIMVRNIGEFHGMMTPTTPSGSRSV